MIKLAPSPALSRKIIRNVLFNLIGRLWTMLVSLLLTPYIISKLGVQRFGLWSLTIVITSYFSLLDLGFGTSFVKYIAEYHTREDYKAINGVFNTGLAFHLALAIAIIASVLSLSDGILRLFKIPAELLPEAKFVLVIATVIFSLTNVLGVFQAVINGLQRMDVTNLIALGMSMPRILGTVLFLELGYGLKGLIVNEALVFTLTALSLIFWAFKLLPQLKLGWGFYRRKDLYQLLNYGIKVQISRLADLASAQTGKLLVGYFLGVSPVAFYELGSKVVLTSKRLPRVLLSALLPAASEIDAKEDLASQHRLYTRGSKYLVLAAAPALSFIVAGAPLIMLTWMGRGYERSVLVIQLLAVGHLVHLLTGVGTTIAKGMGRPECETRYSILLLAMNTLLGIILIIKLGFWGVLIATSISLVLSSLYFMVDFHRLLGLPLGRFLKETYLQPAIACLVAGVPLLAFNTLALQAFQLQGRLVNLIALGVEALLFGGVYGGIILRVRYLDAYDRGIFLHLSRILLRA